ncbi:uncharacterized protein N7473_003605 [Penicillium subrubescens]|uniref:uncharacterized protein n=1 Tax=Penicillium subrubescens TaxID=1316194 RepID=UPI0025453625|nr:uncharacterized protein N7473_003605 [Penicillium subrubescens]KAJ5906689.1 hypothetical protein N7473_003605 [Penicillium subrubescens]
MKESTTIVFESVQRGFIGLLQRGEGFYPQVNEQGGELSPAYCTGQRKDALSVVFLEKVFSGVGLIDQVEELLGVFGFLGYCA